MPTECTFASKDALTSSQHCAPMLVSYGQRYELIGKARGDQYFSVVSTVNPQPIDAEPVSLDRLYQEEGPLMFLPAGDGYCAYPIEARKRGAHQVLNAESLLDGYNPDVRRGFGLAADLYTFDHSLGEEFALILGDDKMAFAVRAGPGLSDGDAAQYLFIGARQNVEHYIDGARALYDHLCDGMEDPGLSAVAARKSSALSTDEPVPKEVALAEVEAFMEGWLNFKAPGLYNEILGITLYQTLEECGQSSSCGAVAFHERKPSQIVLLPQAAEHLVLGRYDFVGEVIAHENAHRHVYENYRIHDPATQSIYGAGDLFLYNKRDTQSAGAARKVWKKVRGDYHARKWFNEIQASLTGHIFDVNTPAAFNGWADFCHYIEKSNAVVHKLPADIVALGIDYLGVVTDELRTSSWNEYLVDSYLNDMKSHLDCMNGGRCDQPSDALIELAAAYPQLVRCFEFYEGALNRFID